MIGASLGGPRALATLLRGAAARLPGPGIAVVQHIADGFTEGLAELALGRGVPLPVRGPGDGDALQPGRVLLAPTGAHLLVEERAGPALRRGRRSTPSARR